MDVDMTKRIEELDQKIQAFSDKNKEIDHQIMVLTQKLILETEKDRYLNYYTEEDLYEILCNIEGEPEGMLVIEAQEGTTIDVKNNGVVVIEKSPQTKMGLNYLAITKGKQPSSFFFKTL